MIYDIGCCKFTFILGHAKHRKLFLVVLFLLLGCDLHFRTSGRAFPKEKSQLHKIPPFPFTAGFDVRQLGCQASNLTASAQTFCVNRCFHSFSILICRCAEIQPLSLEAVAASLNMSTRVPPVVLGLCR